MVIRKRITLADIARKCSVSVMAVSLALRERGSLAQATRARIKAVAQELGYAPDPALSALVHYRNRKRRTVLGDTLAYLTCFPTARGWQSQFFFNQAWLGASERAARLGYRLEHVWMSDPRLGPARLAGIFEARGIRGLLIAPLPAGSKRLDFPWDRFSAVAIGPSLSSPLLHAVTANHYQAMQLALQRLRANGYRRVGLVLSKAVHFRLRGQYLAAFRLEQDEGMKPGERVPVLREAEPDDVRLVAWLRRHRPDVLLYHDDRLVDRLRGLGWRVPEDVAFASLGKLHRPEITGVDQPASLIAAAAVDRLDLLLRDNEVGVPERQMSFFVNGVWKEGATAPPLL